MTAKDVILARKLGGGGSGGTEITDGIVVKARDADGYATEVDFYGTDVYPFQLAYTAGCPVWKNISVLSTKTEIINIWPNAFRESKLTDFSSWTGNVMTLGNDSVRESSAVTVCFPKVTEILNYTFYASKSMQSVEIGSIGYAVSSIYNTAFRNCTQTGLTITIYTTAAYADTLLANIRNGATNATIILKASEDTTYNGTSYAAGETMITSTVEASA